MQNSTYAEGHVTRTVLTKYGAAVVSLARSLAQSPHMFLGFKEDALYSLTTTATFHTILFPFRIANGAFRITAEVRLCRRH